MFSDMFRPRNCFGGAVIVALITTSWFHSASAGMLFGALPFGFGVVGWLRG